MKSLILYATTHGCTKSCAEKIKSGQQGETELINLKERQKPDTSLYDTIIIGGSIHAGRIQGAVKKYCKKNLSLLIEKRIGLFICCMEEGETAEKQFNDAFPDELIKHASARGIFGGEFNFEKMNAIERFIIKKIAKTDQNISKISESNIKQFIKDIST